jgi:hypothetical protein
VRISRYYTDICLERLNTTMNNVRIAVSELIVKSGTRAFDQHKILISLGRTVCVYFFSQYFF